MVVRNDDDAELGPSPHYRLGGHGLGTRRLKRHRMGELVLDDGDRQGAPFFNHNRHSCSDWRRRLWAFSLSVERVNAA